MSQALVFHALPWFDQPLAALMARYDQGQFPQSLLMLGEQGIGKQQFAEDVAQSMLCLNRTHHEPCGQCQSCLWLKRGNHPDYLAVMTEEKSQVIKIDQIRQLIEFAQMTSETGRKVIVIHNADEMNVNAANALLKTLEEPTPNCYLILVSNYPKKLPITITSRCQRLPLTLHDTALAFDWLCQALPNTAPHIIEQAMALSYNRPLQAQALLASDGLDTVTTLQKQFAKFVQQPIYNPELVEMMTKNWALASHAIHLWLSQALKGQGNIAGLNAIAPQKLMELYDAFIRLMHLSDTTVKQEWLIQDWLTKFVTP